uniref:Sorting nexin C-terminal domain-containing protein n=1 Tax=Meloidogyne floridensis TaxID=298350 RepID=A0A915P4G9_9BILA
MNEDSDNIPLRVLLLFVDEVFGLRAKNQWFRRRLVSLLRQFVNATMGNSINRRIVDAVNWLTSEEQVAQYLVAMRDSIWGNNNNNDSLNGGGGFFTDRQSQNSNNNRQNNNTNTNPQDGRQRTRFLARCLMLSAIPDQLRLFIGIENVSEALQNKHLNRRFWYLIFERLLTTIFPNNRFDRLLPQLHSKSPRAQNRAAM